jgi:hypothetical protein
LLRRLIKMVGICNDEPDEWEKKYSQTLKIFIL